MKDAISGEIELTGWTGGDQTSNVAVVLVHGLGGSANSAYIHRAGAAALEAGWRVLALNLRGAGGRPADLYHAGLTEDIHAALQSPELARVRQIYIWGFSLGGHITLRYCTKQPDPRVVRGVAICPPLELSTAGIHFDQPTQIIYRQYILRALKELYAALEGRRRLPVSQERARKIRGLVEWDDIIVAPHFGFRDAWDYYLQMSVSSRLGQLQVPVLILSTRNDPMITSQSIPHDVEALSEKITMRWIPRGGHVGFLGKTDLGFGPADSVNRQVVQWLGKNL